ncbi:hypothetical protein D3C84_574310 [compost metagenome]
MDQADRLPLRVNLAAFAPVPDFSTPLPDTGERGKHHLIELRRVSPGLEQVGPLPQHVLTPVTGDFHERPVHMDDHAFPIGDQHAFAGAVEHGRRLAQAHAVGIALTQFGADTQTPQQPRPGNEDQPGTEQHPDITVDQLPSQSLGRAIEETV